MMNIQGVVETLPRRAPTAAISMLAAISFLGPYLSETIPLGMLRSNWQRLGIAMMSPICWLVSANSSLRTGKRVVRMFPAAWTSMWVSTMRMRLPLMILPKVDFSFVSMLITDVTQFIGHLSFYFSCIEPSRARSVVIFRLTSERLKGKTRE